MIDRQPFEFMCNIWTTVQIIKAFRKVVVVMNHDESMVVSAGILNKAYTVLIRNGVTNVPPKESYDVISST